MAPRFNGDNNFFVMKIQHDEYGNMIVNLLENSKNEYSHFEWNAMIDPKLMKRIQTKKYFDHRVLQWAHDIIAGVYRYILCPWEEIDYFQNNIDF